MSYFFKRAESLAHKQVGGYGAWDDSNKKEKKAQVKESSLLKGSV